MLNLLSYQSILDPSILNRSLSSLKFQKPESAILAESVVEDEKVMGKSAVRLRQFSRRYGANAFGSREVSEMLSMSLAAASATLAYMVSRHPDMISRVSDQKSARCLYKINQDNLDQILSLRTIKNITQKRLMFFYDEFGSSEFTTAEASKVVAGSNLNCGNLPSFFEKASKQFPNILKVKKNAVMGRRAWNLYQVDGEALNTMINSECSL